MRLVIIFSTLILLLVAGKALTEVKTGAGDNNPRPHAIDVAAEAAAEPSQEKLPPEDSEQPIGAAEPIQEPPPQESAPLLDAAELDQLVAPIALYPDALLAQVLIAATYPLEVVDADRFVAANKTLKGDALTAELAKQDWDDSVKALVEAPEVLAMMSAELDWMQSLGDAVLAQQPDVMEAVQRLRAKAEASGKLASTEQQRVVVSEEAGQREIVIQPAQPQVVYVPYYEPSEVYGPWPYPSHPPYAFAPPPPRYGPSPVIVAGIAFGAGYLLGNAMSDGFDWRDRHIRVHRPRHAYDNRNYGPRREVYNSNWRHNAHHRRGVKYKNASVWRKYAKGNKARPQPGFAARRKPGGPYYGAVPPGQRFKAKPGPYGKFGDAKRNAGPPNWNKPPKPPKQFTRKPPGGYAAIAKKPNPGFKPPKPPKQFTPKPPGGNAAIPKKPNPGFKPPKPPKQFTPKPPGGNAAIPKKPNPGFKPPKPPKQFTGKPPDRQAAIGPKKPNPKFKPRPAAATKAINAKPGPRANAAKPKPKGPPKNAYARGPGKPPPKAVYKGKGGHPQVAKGNGGGKGKNAHAQARAKLKAAAHEKKG